MRTDILNVLNPCFHRASKIQFQARDRHKRMEDARHLSKYVFPREYGLATVFASATKAYKYPDFADREDEIKVRVEYALHYLQLLRHDMKKAPPSKTPKRVKFALDLLDKMIGRHGTCSYKTLRDITCPSNVNRPEQQALDSSIILVCSFT
jgi:hypothetical protein